MAKFKVKAGVHVQAGKVFSKGETVESEADLYTLFPQKFEAPAGSPEAEEQENDDDTDEAPTRGRRSRKKAASE